MEAGENVSESGSIFVRMNEFPRRINQQGMIIVSENRKETLAQEQRRTKPNLEDKIAARASMDEEAKQVAYAFLDYCNAKNITYKWSSTNRWNLNAKGKTLGYVGIGIRKHDDNSWNIITGLSELLQYEDFIHKEGLAEVIYNNIHYCEECNKIVCSRSATILGKEYHNLCGVAMCFKNPDTEALKSVQKILDFRLNISHGTASRPILDPVTDGLHRINNKLRVSQVSDLHGSTNVNMDNLFDGKYNSYCYAGSYESFMLTGSNHDIVFQLDEASELKIYGLVTGLRLDAPDKWALYGAESRNGQWVLLDTQDEFPKPVTLYTEKTFRINTPKAYRYYRITFESQYFVISQVHLYVQ